MAGASMIRLFWRNLYWTSRPVNRETTLQGFINKKPAAGCPAAGFLFVECNPASDRKSVSVARVSVLNPAAGIDQSLVKGAEVETQRHFPAVAARNDRLLLEADSNLDVAV